jgi:hypothetical protein
MTIVCGLVIVACVAFFVASYVTAH